MASEGKALSGLWFEEQRYFASTLDSDSKEKDLPLFEQTKQWLDCYFLGCEPKFTPPVLLNGTPFQMSVWEILKTIPYGKVITYKDIATKIAHQRGIQQMSAQAVGGAVSRNPISIIVPCHRVIGTDNNLTGYASGVERKLSLLKIEHISL